VSVAVNWRRLAGEREGDVCPYAEVTADEWATVAAADWTGTVDPANPSTSFTVKGSCPRCGHAVAQAVVLAVDLTPAVANLAIPNLATCEATVRCDCGKAHSGRPSDGKGCGAYWRFAFQWSMLATNPATVRLFAGRRATPEDLRELEQLDELDKGELERVRSAADKWKTGLAALLGLTATVSVVKGRDSFSSLSTTSQHVIIVILAAALVCAMVAALLAMSAAYGPLRRQLLGTADLRTLRLKAAEGARRDLRLARGLTVLAVALLAAAIGITWWASEPTPAMARITKADNSSLCAKYVRSSEQAIFIGDGSAATGIPFAQVKRVAFSQSC
jgi:hypothetical protein